MTATAMDQPRVGTHSGTPAELRRQLVGKTVAGRFRCVEVIGGGGMGTVYRAEHLRLGRHFALKVLHPELSAEPAMIERFERESRIVASLSSEHIVGIVDAGLLEDRSPFFVMDLLAGVDLRRILRRSAVLAPLRAVNLAIDVCRGLHVAHQKRLVHRDLKPENLFVVRGDDGRELTKILDFGVAKAAGNDSTQPGSLLGTARYMAPEQIGLDHPIGAHTDLYAVAVILYECLSGVVPFDGDSTERILYAIVNARPTPLAQRCPELPRGLATLVDQALARDPASRPASARVLAEALIPFSGSRSSGVNGWQVAVAEQSAVNVTMAEPEPSKRDTVREERDPMSPMAVAGKATTRRHAVALSLATALGAVAATTWQKLASPGPAAEVNTPSVASDSRRPGVGPEQTPPVAPSSTPPRPSPPASATHASASSSTTTGRAAASPSQPVSKRTRLPQSAPTPAPTPHVPVSSFDPLNPYAR